MRAICIWGPLLLLLSMSCTALGQSNPNVQFSDLTVTPSIVAVGQQVSVSFSATNQSSQLAVEGIAVVRVNEDVEIEVPFGPISPAKTTSIRQILSFPVPGSYLISVEGTASVMLVVLEQAVLVFRDLTLSKTQLDVGEVASVSVLVRNVGGTSGTAVAQLIVDGKVKDQITVFLGSGREVRVVFQMRFTSDEFGRHTITVNDLPSLSLTVLGRSSVSVEAALDENGNLRVDDAEIVNAVELWITGFAIPGTGGQRIDDALIIALIRMWVSGEAFATLPTHRGLASGSFGFF